MGIERSTILAAVERAFEAAGDLVQPVSFSREGVQGFDWATQQLVKTTPPATTVYVLLYQDTKSGSEVSTRALVREADWPGELYSTLHLGSVSYRVANFTVNPGLVELELRSN